MSHEDRLARLVSDFQAQARAHPSAYKSCTDEGMWFSFFDKDCANLLDKRSRDTFGKLRDGVSVTTQAKRKCLLALAVMRELASEAILNIESGGSAPREGAGYSPDDSTCLRLGANNLGPGCRWCRTRRQA